MSHTTTARTMVGLRVRNSLFSRLSEFLLKLFRINFFDLLIALFNSKDYENDMDDCDNISTTSEETSISKVAQNRLKKKNRLLQMAKMHARCKCQTFFAGPKKCEIDLIFLIFSVSTLFCSLLRHVDHRLNRLTGRDHRRPEPDQGQLPGHLNLRPVLLERRQRHLRRFDHGSRRCAAGRSDQRGRHDSTSMLLADCETDFFLNSTGTF